MDILFLLNKTEGEGKGEEIAPNAGTKIITMFYCWSLLLPCIHLSYDFCR